MKSRGLRKAIKKAGSETALARLINVTRSAIGQWEIVPSERVLSVEAVTGVPCWELRPDLYPPARFKPKEPEMSEAAQ